MKTKIFVSSTCFDLAVLRENLGHAITNLGHDPLLSEYRSFPVDPDVTTIQNCKKNIRESTNIFVLIIGGARGSIDRESKKTITNLEYETARQMGVPIFVFVKKDVLGLMPMWKSNPEADFNPAVDHSEVFSFVERIQNENRWIFPFESSQELQEILVNQLSFLFSSLLKQKLEGKLRADSYFSQESERAKELVRDKPRYWEYLLTEELLRSKLSVVDDKFNDLKKGQIFQPVRSVKPRELLDLIQLKMTDLINLVDMLPSILAEFGEAWGPTGVPGDAKLIHRTVQKIVDLSRELVNWEVDLLSIEPIPELKPLMETMKGWTEVVYREIKTIPEELAKPFLGSETPSGLYNIHLKIEAPPADAFYRELERLRTNQLHLFR